MKVDVKRGAERRRNCNLTREERDALSTLKGRTDIVIKPADKGGTVVAWRKDNYRNEMKRHLTDTAAYKQIHNQDDALRNAQMRSKRRVLKLFENKTGDGKGLMQAGARDFFLAFESIIPHLYLLPKIHNSLEETTGTWQGRPVLSGRRAPTRPVDWICTALLNPLLRLLPERIKDTTDFLKKIAEIRGPVPRGARLFSMDVVSLYPSIPQREAAKVVASFFTDNRAKIRQELQDAGVWRTPSKETLEEAILHVMRDTLLQFEGRAYQQTKGTVIGASSSVAIAEIFVHVVLERKRSHRKDGPAEYFRYIDDIFGIMEDGFPRLGFFSWSNTVHENLKFTLEHSDSTINFLDTTVYIDQLTRDLHTKAYYKPTNLHTYLKFDSSHPLALKKSLPYSLGLRLKRINSKEETLYPQLDDLWDMFRNRDYPETIIHAAQEKLRDKTRAELLRPRTQEVEDKRWILPTLFFPGLTAHLKIKLQEVWTWMRKTYSEHPSWVKYPQNPPMIAWRRGKSIKDHLVRAAVLVDHLNRTGGEDQPQVTVQGN
ncbi:uncharacterized protein [Procambarus clarkii]|uniref:uncharacterized protein n=1 Tax=Procambarus clarkii TaxID=6728 RepID=UPI001E6721D4|nr:uncharacterized protein LOC123765588 [Procambarus clarkii]